MTTHSGATVTTYKPVATWRPAATTVYVSPVYVAPVVRAPVYSAAKPTVWLTPQRDWRAPQRYNARFDHHHWRR